MQSLEQTFSDIGGNHLLVALYFCDNDYKLQTLNIPEEYANIDIVDINIEKAYLEKPIHPAVFFKMSSWLLEVFEKYDNAIFTFICSTDDLDTNHSGILPQTYRWKLFNCLFHRFRSKCEVNIQDVIVGPEGYQTYGRAFYRNQHSPIIHIVASHLLEKQQGYV